MLASERASPAPVVEINGLVSNGKVEYKKGKHSRGKIRYIEHGEGEFVRAKHGKGVIGKGKYEKGEYRKYIYISTTICNSILHGLRSWVMDLKYL